MEKKEKNYILINSLGLKGLSGKMKCHSAVDSFQPIVVLHFLDLMLPCLIISFFLLVVSLSSSGQDIKSRARHRGRTLQKSFGDWGGEKTKTEKDIVHVKSKF